MSTDETTRGPANQPTANASNQSATSPANQTTAGSTDQATTGQSDQTSSGRHPGWYLLVGSGIVVFGLAVAPGVSARLPIDLLLALLGNDYFMLGLFGGFSLVIFGWMVGRRARSHVTQASPPEPETIQDAPPPGRLFDQFLDGSAGPLSGSSESDSETRERARAAAVGEVMRTEGVSRDRARDIVAEGDWTSDPVAAAFLSEGPTSRPTIRDRIGLALRGESWTQRGARATARVLVRRTADEGRRTADEGRRTADEEVAGTGGTGPGGTDGENPARAAGDGRGEREPR